MRVAFNALRYGMVGLINSAIGFSVIIAVLHAAPHRTVLANILGFGVGFITSFLLNKSWTFADSRPIHMTLAPYVALVAVSYLANLLVVLLAGQIPVLGLYVPQLLGMATYTGLSFLGAQFVVFRKEAV